MTEAGSDVLFRPHILEDIPFIHSSWGKSYYKGSGAIHTLSPEEFHSFHRPIRDRILTQPNATVIVAADVDHPDHIMGWIAVGVLPSCLVLHYVYVKSAFKGFGIASQLIRKALPSGKVVYTHMTARASKILARNYENYRGFAFVPHAI